MTCSLLTKVLPVAASAVLLVPAVAQAQGGPTTAELADQLNVVWVMLAASLVLFMQAGFLLLEVGFSRQKNAGAGVAKILVNLSIASVVWWAIGFGLAFGGDGWFAGTSGFFYEFGQSYKSYAADATSGLATGGTAAFFVFQFMFAAVSLAIVWGTTLERIKFIAYPIFAVVFTAFIYPVVAHWGFGGGLFADIGGGVQDFAGSTVVHLTGATAALAALLLLGPRKGKFGPDGKARAIPGHNMPLFGLGVIVLWLGWFGFNGGSTLGTADNRFAEVVLVTNLGAAGGVIGASLLVCLLTRKLDVGMSGNGAIAGLVAITAPSGYVEFWAAPIIGLIGGFIVVLGVYGFERIRLDDPVGALSAHGLAGIWGTLACGLFASPRLVEYIGVGDPGLFYSGSLKQVGVQAAGVAIAFTFVLVTSLATFGAIKVLFGLRVSDQDEIAGLDISEHGMYGYPEQFIPESELVGYGPIDATLSESEVTA
jgi:Amt family ammonium transporter